MEEAGTSGAKETKKKPKVEKKTAENTETKHKKTMVEEVCEAVGTLGIPRKGASAQAVRKYILSKHEESEHGRVKTRLNQAFGKALEQGMLTRPASSKDTTGATGYFMLAKKNDKEKVKPSDAKMRKVEKAESDDEPTSKPTKGAKKLFTQEKIEKKASKPKKENAKPKSKTTKEKSTAPKNPKKIKATETTEDEEQIDEEQIDEQIDEEQIDEEQIDEEQISDSEVLPKKKAKQVKSHSSDSKLMDVAEKNTGKSKVSKNPAKSAKADVTEKSKLPNSSKTAKKVKVLKKQRTLNKTYSDEERKDLSDSEIMVKKTPRKSIKSYSSDSELPDLAEKNVPVKEPARKRQNTKH